MGTEINRTLETLRGRWPGQRLYVFLDNNSPHRHPHVRAWAGDNETELVPLPTYGSWLNWIGSEFAALRYDARNRSDHRRHAKQNTAISGYGRDGDRRTRPKTTSPELTRSWTSYPAKAA